MFRGAARLALCCALARSAEICRLAYYWFGGTGAAGAGPDGLPGIVTSKARADAFLEGQGPTCCSAGRWDRICRYATHSAARAEGGPAPMFGPHS